MNSTQELAKTSATSKSSASSRTKKEEKKAADKKRASHDAKAPGPFVDFMLKDWETPKIKAQVHPEAERYKKRRKALARQFPGEVLVIPTGHEKFRANDTAFGFRPGRSRGGSMRY